MRNMYAVIILTLALFTESCSFDQNLFYHEDSEYGQPTVSEEEPGPGLTIESAETEMFPSFVVPENPLDSVPPVVSPEENEETGAQPAEEEIRKNREEKVVPRTERASETVEILGEEYDVYDAFIDLSRMNPEDVPAVSEQLSQLKGYYKINLMREDGTSPLSVKDVKALQEAAPEIHFEYEFDLFGQRVSTTDRRIVYTNVPIGNEGEEEIRDALSILYRCEYFCLDDCGLDDEVMDRIRSDFPDTKVVWRIHVANKSALTDDQVIRMTHGINDAVTGPLQYCNEVVYMDLGHDAGITDIFFIEHMPKLECIILSDAKMKDITPLSYCPNLTWVELVYCDRMTDITPIADMESIRYLNISYSGIRDFTAIDRMNLERFCAISVGFTDEMLEAYQQSHPDTLVINTGNPYGYAWRYNDYGYTFYWYYWDMRKAFRYTDPSPGGFKLPEELVEKREKPGQDEERRIYEESGKTPY